MKSQGVEAKESCEKGGMVGGGEDRDPLLGKGRGGEGEPRGI